MQHDEINLQLALEDAQAYYRGLRNKRQERGQEDREPFYMSQSMKDRLIVQGLLKLQEENRIKKAIADRIAEQELRFMVELQDHYCSKGVYVA